MRHKFVKLILETEDENGNPIRTEIDQNLTPTIMGQDKDGNPREILTPPLYVSYNMHRGIKIEHDADGKVVDLWPDGNYYYAIQVGNDPALPHIPAPWEKNEKP